MSKASLLLSLVDGERLYEIWRAIRWPEGVRCLKCGHDHLWLDHEEAPKMQYRCPECNHWFTDHTGSFIENCHVPLKRWLWLLYLMSKARPVTEMADEIDVARSTVYRMQEKMERSLSGEDRDFEDILRVISDRLEGVVEVDEAYVNAGQKGKEVTHRKARERARSGTGRGTWQSDRIPIIGLVERGSNKFYLEIVESADMDTCHEVIGTHVAEGSEVHTDGWPGYNGIDEELNVDHESVSHSSGEYAREGEKHCVHCNTMEGYWPQVREFLKPHRGVSKENLSRYITWFQLWHHLESIAAPVVLSIVIMLLH